MKRQKETIHLKPIEYGDVSLTDPYLVNAFCLECKYLNELDADRLLAGFLETAGFKPRAERYPGWESTEIQGHTLGHYLTALSQTYGVTKEEQLREKIEYILSELERSQAPDGYLFASPREFFDRVENKKPVWVPWYTMHKIVEGLVAAYRFTESITAYKVMNALGLWIYQRCSVWTKEQKDIVLAVEYGGMNDCLYDIYLETGDERFAAAAHQFDEIPLFEALKERKDILNGLHANTTIPKIVGAVKRYIAFGKSEEFYLEAAENFWDIVISHHTYITGGNSEWEHFGEPDILDGERTACNCETCNIYNMLKLSRLLFGITKDKKYADYYERAQINTILSSQNPATGMTTYFQPMATGFFKVYSTPFDRFWCCTGTGMENFTKLTEGIYFEEKGRIYVNRYVSSEVISAANDISLSVEADLLKEETVVITVKQFIEPRNAGCVELALRIPQWVKETPQIISQGSVISVKEEGGYWIVSGAWKEGDRLEFKLPISIQVHSLPDNENVVAFTYGSFVLSAGLGKQMLDTTITGVDVLVPKKELLIKDYIVLENVDISDWKNHIEDYLIRTPGKNEFVLKHTESDGELIFTPHFARYEDRYGIYFRLYQKESPDLRSYSEQTKQKLALAKSQIDMVPIGNDQYELAHQIRGEKTDTARLGGHRCRYAKEDGWFSYQFELTKEAAKLCVTYCSEDAGIAFDIIMNGRLFLSETVTRQPEEFYTKEYELPSSLITGNNTVTVKFQNKDTKYACRIFDELFIRK